MTVTTYETDAFPEKGTVGIEISFTDENGNAVTPDSITWTLTNMPASYTETPTVINNREDVSVTPDSTVTVVLKGDDLSLLSTELDESFVDRVLSLEYTYTSSYGSGLPGKAQYIFTVENMYYNN
ncbi:MAG: hypothetical protein JRJ31_16980 [Deltaproteobacteria bacterium]|nr:hypothetical protein [Deltaproteobacteria bacterium]